MEATVAEQIICQWDFQKNKKLALLVNGFGLLLMAVMFTLMYWAMPIQMMRWGMERVGIVFWLLLLLAAIALCGLVKALVHKVSRKPGEKEIRGTRKGSYILRSLLPMLAVGLILIVAQAIVSTQWRWFVFLVQMVNVAGTAQELIVALRLLFAPRDALVVDLDMGVKVYLPEKQEGTYEEA